LHPTKRERQKDEDREREREREREKERKEREETIPQMKTRKIMSSFIVISNYHYFIYKYSILKIH
jgi:hypothetical protein